MAVDVSNPNWWASLIGGLLTKGEWKVLILTILVTFAETYILKAFYYALVSKRRQKTAYVRLIAIAAGFVSAFFVWQDGALSMHWYVAGMLAGPSSIALFHVLLGMAHAPPLRSLAPWLGPVLRGEQYADREKC